MELGEILISVFTGVVAISTVAYALLTWRLVSETRRLREVQTEPRVSMRLELATHVGHGGIELVIRNEGQGPAQNIRFNFQGDPTYFIDHGQDQPVDQITAIKNGLPYLGPGQDFRILMGWLYGEAFERASQQPWLFHVAYENSLGKLQSSDYTLDFSQFSGLIIGGGPPLVKIEKHLEAIKNDFSRIATGTRKIQVLTQTKKEYLNEREDLVRQRRRGTKAVESGSESPKASG